MRDGLLIAAYLGAIVAANLAVTHFGPTALPLTAFVLIPFDLFSRDLLHERWRGPRLYPRMMALVATGSLLSFAINRASLPIALASCVSFAIAGMCDSIVYEVATGAPKGWKMNLSNLASSIADSLLFPLIAFGVFSPSLSATQAAAKFIGGALWTLLYLKTRKGRNVHAQ